MTIKIKLKGKQYSVKIFDSKGKLLHEEFCKANDLEDTIDNITAEFSKIII